MPLPQLWANGLQFSMQPGFGASFILDWSHIIIRQTEGHRLNNGQANMPWMLKLQMQRNKCMILMLLSSSLWGTKSASAWMNKTWYTENTQQLMLINHRQPIKAFSLVFIHLSDCRSLKDRALRSLLLSLRLFVQEVSRSSLFCPYLQYVKMNNTGCYFFIYSYYVYLLTVNNVMVHFQCFIFHIWH